MLLCNFARQVLRVTASGFCSSSGRLWVAALPNHRNPAEVWQRCDIRHSPLRRQPCTVQEAQAPLLPHHHHPIPSPTKQESQQQLSATTAGASHEAGSPLLSRELWLQGANTELHGLSLLQGTRSRAVWDTKELLLYHEGPKHRISLMDPIKCLRVRVSSHKNSLWDSLPFRQARQLAGRDLHLTINASSFKNLSLANKGHCHTAQRQLCKLDSNYFNLACVSLCLYSPPPTAHQASACSWFTSSSRRE